MIGVIEEGPLGDRDDTVRRHGNGKNVWREQSFDGPSGPEMSFEFGQRLLHGRSQGVGCLVEANLLPLGFEIAVLSEELPREATKRGGR